MVVALGIWLVAYFIGAIPFGYVIARARGVDLFTRGSGNIGATNVGRALGVRFGLVVFLLDFLKGAVPVALARMCASSLTRDSTWLAAGWLEVGTGLAALLGHVFPIYLGFRGGKGVATGAGVVCMLLPLPALGALLVWIIFLLATRCVALASLAAAFSLLLLRISMTGTLDLQDPYTLFCVVAFVLVVVRHRSNIMRLFQGTEPRVPNHPALFTVGKTLHILALGLWFGSAVFFSIIVALSLFHTFGTLSDKPAPQRPAWFPLVEPFDKSNAEVDGPREQGSRAAGYAVGPLFDWYFLLQGMCGCIAFGTAWPWRGASSGTKIHTWRAYLLLAAVVSVLVGWPLEQHVADLRGPRNDATLAYLAAATADADARLAEMQSARREFGRWHGYSLMLNFVTLALVTASMALAARLPGEDSDE